MDDTERTLQAAADQLVRQEVHYCVSSLVSTLASGYGKITLANEKWSAACRDPGEDTLGLTDQALDLASPVLDYESAAREAGWKLGWEGWASPNSFRKHAHAHEIPLLEPHECEVFEHWIVSDWLADKLAEKGEKVDKDFAGLTVWARTTTGQGIASDSAIRAIVKETGYAMGAASRDGREG